MSFVWLNRSGRRRTAEPRSSGLVLSHRDIVSGAGHDALFLAELGPAGMICVLREGGISHHKIENAALEHLAAGCALLLRAMVAASAMVAAECSA